VIAGIEKPINDHVKGFGHVHGEGDTRRIGNMKQGCESFSGMLYNARGFHGKPVS